MLDGLPLHPLEEGGEGDGDVREHKEGERKYVEDLLSRGGADVLPLGEGGDGADEEHQQIGIDQELGSGPQGDQHILPGQEAQHRRGGVGADAHNGQHDGWHDGHGHIKAGKAVALGNALEQLEAVGLEDLHVAPGPAHPLAAGLAEGGGLLVVEDGVLAVAHPLAGDDVGDGKLDILGKEEEVPAAPLLQDAAAEAEAGAGDGAAGLQQVAGMVEEGGLPQEPKGIAGGNPVVGVVLGIPVAGDDLIAVGEGAVHLRDVVGLQQVIRVEDEEAVEYLAVVPINVGQQLIHGVALAHLDAVEPLIDHGAVLPGYLRRRVGAVVGDDKSRHQVAGVVLTADGVQQMADDGLFIAGGDQNGIAVQLGGAVRLVLFKKRDGQIEKLIRIAQDKQSGQGKV